jgi:hypothetical protein
VKQDPKDIEQSYQTPDPWGYQTRVDDVYRRSNILAATFRMLTPPYQVLTPDGPRYRRALDIGAGEGWITKFLPALEIHGYEISDTAASRFPANVKRVLEPEGYYDLVVATGVMYEQYEWEKFLAIIKQHASRIVVMCNIKDWEVEAVKHLPHLVWTQDFPYCEYTERIRVYDLTT